MTVGEDWEAAMGEAMTVEKPAEGWPSPEEMQAKEKGRKDSDASK